MNALKLPFDSLLPESIPTYGGHLVLATTWEAPDMCRKPALYEDIFEKPITVIRGLVMQKLDIGYSRELLIGIDPGKWMGLSVFYRGREIENSVHSSVDGLVSHIVRILGGLEAKHKIIRIGDGNMDVAQQVIGLLNIQSRSPFELELVNEQNTSMKIKNYNQRGKRDMLSARYITQREGTRYSILPHSH